MTPGFFVYCIPFLIAHFFFRFLIEALFSSVNAWADLEGVQVTSLHRLGCRRPAEKGLSLAAITVYSASCDVLYHFFLVWFFCGYAVISMSNQASLFSQVFRFRFGISSNKNNALIRPYARRHFRYPLWHEYGQKSGPYLMPFLSFSVAFPVARFVRTRIHIKTASPYVLYFIGRLSFTLLLMFRQNCLLR